MTNIAKIPALILAGGKASRMGGGDKPLLLLNGQPLLQHVIERLRPQVSSLALSANGDPSRFANFSVQVLPDQFEGFPGPLAGIHAGLLWAKALSATILVSVSGDTPFLPPDLVTQLQRLKAPLTYARSNGRDHPTIALWPVSMLEAVETALKQERRALYKFMQAHGAKSFEWVGESDSFFNINTPQDLEAAEHMIKSHMA